MIITTIQINIETDGTKDDEHLSPKCIAMVGGAWNLPNIMFPREIRFVAALQELVETYNGKKK